MVLLNRGWELSWSDKNLPRLKIRPFYTVLTIYGSELIEAIPRYGKTILIKNHLTENFKKVNVVVGP